MCAVYNYAADVISLAHVRVVNVALYLYDAQMYHINHGTHNVEIIRAVYYSLHLHWS